MADIIYNIANTLLIMPSNFGGVKLLADRVRDCRVYISYKKSLIYSGIFKVFCPGTD